MEWKSPGKKAPCPCGTGDRYGDCCGLLEKLHIQGEAGARFAAMKSIAYKGKIGRKREAFCTGYIANKTGLLRGIRKTLASAESQTGKKVTCEKGCTICCSMYIEASIQECEAIVYYLYQHDAALTSFLRSYHGWRAALKEKGDIFKGRSKYWEPQATVEKAAILWREFTEDEDRYFAQGIPCPFLSKDMCVIYEVRPYVCASYAAVTPPDYCRFGSENRPGVIKAIPHGVRSDRSFYYPEQLAERVLSTMPIMVYEILKSGLTCFSKAGIKGLEDLDRQWLADPEVSAIYRKYVR
jgi:Fe-S-cluster containining protein